MKPPLLFALLALATSPGQAARNSDQTQAVRQALEQSVDAAVSRLGRTDGFWANPKLRIPLPPELLSLEKTLRRYGLERYVEDFAQSLSRAAEAAVPIAKPVLLAAIRDMSLRDALAIVRGDDHAATQYFKLRSDAILRERLKPIVAEATANANVTGSYKRLLKKAVFLEKSVDPTRLDLDAHVTRAALDGLYLLMAEEERRIRRDPLARGTELLKKIFR